MMLDAWPSSLDATASGHVRQGDQLHISMPTAGGLILWLEHHEDQTVVHVEGALDLAGGAELGATIEQVRTERAPRMIVDAMALRFVDLSGYRALVACLAPQPQVPSDARPVLLVGPAIARLRQLVELAGCHLDRDGPVAGAESVRRVESP